MQLGELLDGVIFKEAYKGVNVTCKIYYDLSELPKHIVEKIKNDKEYKERFKEKLTKQLQHLCYENLEVIDIDPSSNSLEITYTAYYTGSKQYPEVHLKTLLLYYNEKGRDIRDPEVFDGIVEEVKRALGEKSRDCKEKRLNHFATLFKEAIAQEPVIT
jgi:hypothetical protein